MQSLRSRTSHFEFVFNRGDDEGHALIALLAHLKSTRTVGVGPSNGYVRSRPTAVRRRFAYDRDILRAVDGLGGIFPEEASPEPWTGLGDVDIFFVDARGGVLGETVTHEQILITTQDEGHADR
ncbi:hypothetical protein GCM10010458_11060 [Microbacterium luteolum]|uniref:Uncharacterized protein n=1 Tax=Microbacterium luteolum TaxID=69367 RepID=A0ABY7XVF0_MICLT|nr:hypothetical protein [Microbacterium luteolum]WDM43853.1 hypothetical protein KV395_11625 [Microbacterium luteolum]